MKKNKKQTVTNMNNNMRSEKNCKSCKSNKSEMGFEDNNETESNS